MSNEALKSLLAELEKENKGLAHAKLLLDQRLEVLEEEITRLASRHQQTLEQRSDPEDAD